MFACNSPALFLAALLTWCHDPHSLPLALSLRQATKATCAFPPRNPALISTLRPTFPEHPPRPLHRSARSNPLRSFVLIVHPRAPTLPSDTLAGNQFRVFFVLDLPLNTFSPHSTGRTVTSTSAGGTLAPTVLMREP